MARQQTLELGHCTGAERWIEVRINGRGECALVLADEAAPGGVAAVFPCSFMHLQIVGQGMSYQANTGYGYIMMSAMNGCLHVYAKCDGDTRTWTCSMPLVEFNDGVKRLNEALLLSSYGYAA